MVGGDYTPRNLACLKPHGRLVLIALLNGAKTTIDLVPFLMKRVHMTGSTLRGRDVDFKAALAQVIHQRVWPLVETGLVRPVIDSTFPLSKAADAHRRMEADLHIGKILLTMDKD
jgi:NADPH:quinone reductase-like Zn-dependent oxidoreductase